MRNPARKTVTLPTGSQVKNEAVQTIIERMGITKAALFLRENMSQPVDYLAMKDQMFAKTSAAEIFSAIKSK